MSEGERVVSAARHIGNCRKRRCTESATVKDHLLHFLSSYARLLIPIGVFMLVCTPSAIENFFPTRANLRRDRGGVPRFCVLVLVSVLAFVLLSVGSTLQFSAVWVGVHLVATVCWIVTFAGAMHLSERRDWDTCAAATMPRIEDAHGRVRRCTANDRAEARRVVPVLEQQLADARADVRTLGLSLRMIFGRDQQRADAARQVEVLTRQLAYIRGIAAGAGRYCDSVP